MKKATLLLFLCSMLTIGFSQTIMPCLHDLGVHAMEQEYPGYREAVAKTFQDAKNSVRPRTQDIYSIPVVVHVVWKNPDENLPIEEIEDQIEVLNLSFRRQNADTSNMRPIFADVAGDAGIEFFLHDVVRVETTAEFEPSFSLSTFQIELPEEVKRTAEGGSDPYDVNHFLNIWVCQMKPLSLLGMDSPVLGYAYPPAGLPNWPPEAIPADPNLQGVVVDFRAFGKGKTFSVPDGTGGQLILPMEGRTTVHEVGHYLGLRHIWGDGQGAIFGGVDCDADDGVDDTPNQGAQSPFNCDTSLNTCTDATDDRPDMIENYMDYSRETCQNSFTKGQIDIMRGVIEGPRSGLLSPPSSTSSPAFAEYAEVFPNPFNSTLTVEVPERGMTYMIQNVLGQTMRTDALPQGRSQLDLNAFEKGVYYFSVVKGGTVATTKVIKQ